MLSFCVIWIKYFYPIKYVARIKSIFLTGCILLITGCTDNPNPVFWAEDITQPGVKKIFVEMKLNQSTVLAWDRTRIEADIGLIANTEISPPVGNVDPQSNRVIFTPQISTKYTATFTGSDGLLTTDSGEIIVLRDYCGGTDVRGNDYVVNLDLQLPNSNDFPEGNYPAVVFIHPGGWNSGDYSDFFAYMPEATKRGYAAISINYRLSNSSEVVWPGHIQDAKCAVRWLRANAITLDINPNAIAAVGFSAGGHLAAMLGVTDQSAIPEIQAEIDRFKDEGGYASIDDSVQAVVSIAGTYDLAAAYFDEGGADVYTMFLGRLPENLNDPLYALASPVFFMDEQSAVKPYLLISSEVDDIVPPKHSCRLKLAVEAAGGNDATVLLYPNGSHLSYVEYRDFRNLFSGATLTKTIANTFHFLDFHFMSGPEPSADYSGPIIDSAGCETIMATQ